MSVRHLAATLTQTQDPTVYGWTLDRVWASAAAILALAAVILGGWALRTARRNTTTANRVRLVTLILGLFAGINGVLVLVTADAGPGSGNGIVGGYVAVILGVAAAILSGLALTRSRTAQSS